MTSYWMSPFRRAVRYFTLTAEGGKAESVGVPHFVADVAPSKSMKRQSVEIGFPVEFITNKTKDERDRLLSERVSEALKTFGIDIPPSNVTV